MPGPSVLFDTPRERRVRAAVEALRWSDGPVCPGCGSVNESGTIATFPGRWQCRRCRVQYRVVSGTPLDASHLPLSLWIRALKLVAARPDILGRELMQALGVSQRTAWSAKNRARVMLRTKLGRAMCELSVR